MFGLTFLVRSFEQVRDLDSYLPAEYFRAISTLYLGRSSRRKLGLVSHVELAPLLEVFFGVSADAVPVLFGVVFLDVDAEVSAVVDGQNVMLYSFFGL